MSFRLFTTDWIAKWYITGCGHIIGWFFGCYSFRWYRSIFIRHCIWWCLIFTPIVSNRISKFFKDNRVAWFNFAFINNVSPICRGTSVMKAKLNHALHLICWFSPKFILGNFLFLSINSWNWRITGTVLEIDSDTGWIASTFKEWPSLRLSRSSQTFWMLGYWTAEMSSSCLHICSHSSFITALALSPSKYNKFLFFFPYYQWVVKREQLFVATRFWPCSLKL